MKIKRKRNLALFGILMFTVIATINGREITCNPDQSIRIADLIRKRSQVFKLTSESQVQLPFYKESPNPTSFREEPFTIFAFSFSPFELEQLTVYIYQPLLLLLQFHFSLS